MKKLQKKKKPQKKKQSKKKKLYTIDNPKKSNLLTFFAFLFCVYSLMPYVWLFINATKTQKDFASTFGLSFGEEFALFDNIKQAFTYHDGIFVRWLGNSVIYTVIGAFVSTLLAALAGYALAKIKFPFRDQWLLIIMMLLIVPTETVITIHFLIIAKAGLLNTVIGYILPMIVNPFNIFLFRQVFVSLPDDIYEAAQLDFCGPVKYFFTMVLPMSKTVVATVSVFTFLGVWNDYLWPSLVFTSSDLLTAQIGLNSITSNDNTTMGQVLAVITLITIPVMIIYALFSKQIVEGVTSTGSKEG